MRITNRMITNTYLNNLNSSLSDLTNLNQKVTAGRSYLKASDDPVAALKAYQVRQNLSRISLYQDNVDSAESILTDAESSFSELNSVLTSTMEQIIQGESDTCNEDDRDTIAQVLKNYQAEILDIANSKSSNKYIFGGSDMSQKPFTFDSGNLCYHGIDVNSDSSNFPEESLYYDIGLGLETDASGNVVSGSAFDISNPGSEIFGTGTDANGITNNIYNLLGDIAQLFEDNDLTNLDAYVDKLQTLTDNVVIEYSNIGQKTDFLSFLKERLGNNEFNATEQQSGLEGIDEAEAILAYNTQETAYEAALAMGSKIIQYSLLDYLN